MQRPPRRRFHALVPVLPRQPRQAHAAAQSRSCGCSPASSRDPTMRRVSGPTPGRHCRTLSGVQRACSRCARGRWSGSVVAPPRSRLRACSATRCPVPQHLHRGLRQPRLRLPPRQRVRHRVAVPVHLDVVVGADRHLAPLGVLVAPRRQRPQGRPVQLLEQLLPRFRALLEGARVDLRAAGARIASFSSPRLAKRRWRSASSRLRSTSCTQASALALSFGRCGRAGTTACPVMPRHLPVRAVHLRLVAARPASPPPSGCREPAGPSSRRSARGPARWSRSRTRGPGPRLASA